MARISVSELLLDPDFVDPCIVVRQVQKVGDDGVAVFTEVPISILASVQSSGDTLMLGPDAARTEANFEIITNFPLLTASDVTGADIIQWNGLNFRLIRVARFDNFRTGFGHYEGEMELMSINPVPADAM